jgi:hypothetical protein
MVAIWIFFAFWTPLMGYVTYSNFRTRSANWIKVSSCIALVSALYCCYLLVTGKLLN